MAAAGTSLLPVRPALFAITIAAHFVKIATAAVISLIKITTLSLATILLPVSIVPFVTLITGTSPLFTKSTVAIFARVHISA